MVRQVHHFIPHHFSLGLPEAKTLARIKNSPSMHQDPVPDRRASGTSYPASRCFNFGIAHACHGLYDTHSLHIVVVETTGYETAT
jgi:hypothetical protein